MLTTDQHLKRCNGVLKTSLSAQKPTIMKPIPFYRKHFVTFYMLRCDCGQSVLTIKHYPNYFMAHSYTTKHYWAKKKNIIITYNQAFPTHSSLPPLSISMYVCVCVCIMSRLWSLVSCLCLCFDFIVSLICKTKN